MRYEAKFHHQWNVEIIFLTPYAQLTGAHAPKSMTLDLRKAYGKVLIFYNFSHSVLNNLLLIDFELQNDNIR